MKKIKLSLSIFFMTYSTFFIFLIPIAFAKTVRLTQHVDTWTLYTFGNGDIIAGIMFGLQSLVKSTMFANLTYLMMLIGFSGLILSHVTEGKLILTNVVKYIVFTAILLRVLFGLNITIGLVDSINPEYDRVITEVPFLMGAPACFLSIFGHAVAAKLDEVYSHHAGLPLSLTMTGGGAKGTSGAPFSIVAQMLMDGAQYSLQDPFLKDSLTHFIVDCVTPLIDGGYLSSKQLLSSDNLWGLLDVNHISPAIMTVYYDHKDPSFLGMVKTCRQAYKQLDHDLQIEKPNFVFKWGQDITTGAAASLFQTVLNYTARQNNYVPTPASYLQQAALLNILQGPSLNLMAMQTNSPLLMQRLSMQQAIKSAQTSWTITAGLFQATFGYLYAVLQVLVYAMAPMVMALMLLPGLRILIMRRYLQLLAWFPVTLILLAVTNDVLLYWSQQTLGQIWRNHGGLSILGAPFISARAANMSAVGGWLITLVPMMAWGLVAGCNFAMNALLNAPGVQTLSARAATQTVTGNIALDNQSYDNFSANKFSSLMKTDIGAMPTASYNSGTNIVQEDNLGGLEVLKNAHEDMRSSNDTRQVTVSRFATDTQSASDQKSLSDMAELSRSSSAVAESINKITSKLHAGVEGGAIAGAASAYMQKVLADKNYHAIDSATVKSLANDLQTATLASADAAAAQAQGSSGQTESFVKTSAAALEHAFHTLSDKLGGGKKAALAAGALLGAGLSGAAVGIAASLPEGAAIAEAADVVQGGGVLGAYVAKALARAANAAGVAEGASGGAQQMAKLWLGQELSGGAENLATKNEAGDEAAVAGGILARTGKAAGAAGLGAKFLRAFSTAGEGALSLDTEAVHTNKVDSVLTRRQGQQASEQSLASAERRSGKQTTVTETSTETLTSRHPGADYYKAIDIDLAAPADAAMLAIRQKEQAIHSKTDHIQQQITTLKQKAGQALHENVQATQLKGMLDFKSSHAAKAAYQPSNDSR